MPTARTILTLALAGLVVLAGCGGGDGSTTSSPTTSSPTADTTTAPPTTTTAGTGNDGAYPPGWNASGIVNAGVVTDRTAAAFNDTDITEQLFVVRPATPDAEADYQITVTTSRLDRERERLLVTNRRYFVSTDTARTVLEEGPSALADRSPTVETQVYTNASATVIYQKSQGSQPETQVFGDRDYQRVVVQGTVPSQLQVVISFIGDLEIGSPTQSEAGFDYAIEGIASGQFNGTSGTIAVTDTGAITGMELEGQERGQPFVIRYEVAGESVSLDRPEWA